MSAKDKDQDIPMNVVHFLTQEIDIETMASILDRVVWGYAIYLLRDETVCGSSEAATDIYWLKELADILRGEISE